jgi:sulfur-oxidizing protein SoxY
MTSITTMKMTRRRALGLAAGAVTAAMLPVAGRKVMMEFTGGKSPEAGKITLTAPEIAENGNTVPVSVAVDSAMSGDDVVDAVMILAEDNPSPTVATFRFSEMSGKAEATTRIRLAKTQNVLAVVRMKDGAVYMDKKQVKVTIGGCGG